MFTMSRPIDDALEALAGAALQWVSSVGRTVANQ